MFVPRSTVCLLLPFISISIPLPPPPPPPLPKIAESTDSVITLLFLLSSSGKIGQANRLVGAEYLCVCKYSDRKIEIERERLCIDHQSTGQIDSAAAACTHITFLSQANKYRPQMLPMLLLLLLLLPIYQLRYFPAALFSFFSLSITFLRRPSSLSLSL